MDQNFLESAKNRAEIFKYFLQIEHNQGANALDYQGSGFSLHASLL